MTTGKKVDTAKSNLEKVHKFLTECVDKMKTKQDKLMHKHNFGKDNNKFVLYPERNAFYLFNKESQNVFFKAKFQIIGTYSEKSKTWRWGWSNRYVPYDLKQTSLKIKKFGEANKVEILSRPKIKDENLGHIFTALGMELSKSNGYYIVPGTKTYPSIYLIFTNVKKVNLEYADVVKQMKIDAKANHQLMRNKLKPPIKKKVTLKRVKAVNHKKEETQTTKPKAAKKEKKPKESAKKEKKPKEAAKKEKKPTKSKKNAPNKKNTTLKNKKKKVTSKKKKPTSTESNKKSKIKLLRTQKEKQLIPLKKVAKLTSQDINNTDLNNDNNQNNNDYLISNKVSNLSMAKKMKNISSNKNSNSNNKSKATTFDENKSNQTTKLLVPIKKKIIKKKK